MSPEDQKTMTRLWFRRAASLGTAATAILALLGLLGYLPGLRIIGSLRSDYVPMAISTACCFLILAAALFLHARKPRPGFGLMLAEAPVIFATAFGLLSFAGSFAGRDLNFEDMLFPETGKLGKITLGHMSPATGAVFILAGLGAFLLLLALRCSRQARRLGNWAASLGVLTTLAGATVLLSYLYGAPLLYSGSTVPMAATSAIAFLFLGTALVAAAGPESYPMLWVMGDSTSTRLSRVFLPLTMAMVLLQGLLSRFVTASSRINHALFLAVLVIAAGAITALLVIRVAHSIGGSLDQAEDEIKRQLTEKEILLKEVHHRIKNNIASIAGLISLRLQSIANPEAVAVLQEAIGRVDSMRILYDKLLLSEGYKEISVKNYVENLADAIVALFPGSAKVTVEKRIADFPLEPKRLFPLGLIINELITNKMKYAFINRKTGLIKISLANENNHITLIIHDDGVGLPDGFDIDKSKGFGLMLVKMLSQQLAGSFSIESRAGTRSKIEFDI